MRAAEGRRRRLQNISKARKGSGGSWKMLFQEKSEGGGKETAASEDIKEAA